ncbi:hypothetical protein [Paraburkholderia sp.]|uniref:hypothetical protein n=1 Tax=Paraburkholderia sp. TaxID=1926495 RepID=UPI003D6FCA0A
MQPSREFFDLQLRFADRVAALAGLSFEDALLDYTNLYIRFGLGRAFDRMHPVWREYADGLRTADDASAWTWHFYQTYAHETPPPHAAGTFGCFKYADESDDLIRLHFQYADPTGAAALGIERMPARLAELHALFVHVAHNRPQTRCVAGTSWLYHLTGYRRLFPDAYLASATVAPARFRNMPLWGQFLDRHGDVRPHPAAQFIERVARATHPDDLAGCFPLQPLTLEAPVDAFYAFHRVSVPER